MLFNLAAASAFLSIPSIILACLFLVLFLKKDRKYGSINDIFSAITLILLILPAFAANQHLGKIAGSWISIVTLITITGMIVAALGQLLLVSGLVSLKTSFITGGLGILPVIIWMISLVILSFSQGQPPGYVGWFTIIALVFIAMLTTVQILHHMLANWILGSLFMVSAVLWLGSLGQYFLQLRS